MTYIVRLFLAPVTIQLTCGHLCIHARLVYDLAICLPVDTDVDTQGKSDQSHGSCYTKVSTIPRQTQGSGRDSESRAYDNVPKPFPLATQYTTSGRPPVVRTLHRGDRQAPAAGQRTMTRTRGCHVRVGRCLGRGYRASVGPVLRVLRRRGAHGDPLREMVAGRGWGCSIVRNDRWVEWSPVMVVVDQTCELFSLGVSFSSSGYKDQA